MKTHVPVDVSADMSVDVLYLFQPILDSDSDADSGPSKGKGLRALLF